MLMLTAWFSGSMIFSDHGWAALASGVIGIIGLKVGLILSGAYCMIGILRREYYLCSAISVLANVGVWLTFRHLLTH